MSDDESNTSARGGIGLLGAVFLVFLVLKLTGTGVVATWSWWWVTAPLWGGVACALFGIAVAGFLIGVGALVQWAAEKWSR